MKLLLSVVFIYCLTCITATAQVDIVNSVSTLPGTAKVITNPNSEVPVEIQQKCGVFFKNLMDSTAGTAFDIILKDSPVAKNKEQIKNLIDQTLKAIEIYGTDKSYELVKGDVATKSYIRAKYMSMHNLYPMRWIFTFYKSPQLDWILVNLKFDDLTDSFFDE